MGHQASALATTFSFDGDRLVGTAKIPFRWVLKVLDKGVIEQKIMIKPDGARFIEVVTVVHTPKNK